MADSGYGLARRCELLHDSDHPIVETQVFRSTAAGDVQPFVIADTDPVEIGVDTEVVAAFFRIGLIALEIMDGCTHEVAVLLARAYGVNPVAQHFEHLEGHHDFVLFHIVTDEFQYFLHSHLRGV